jgi:uncharacterized protein (DUF1330 family)
MRYQQSEDEMTESLRSWLSSATERKVTQEEIDRCLEAVEKQVPLFPGEMPDFLARLRSWAEADDGKPVYILELMRFYPEVQPFAGAPDYQGTPEQANQYYEEHVAPLLLKHGGYPLVSGMTQGKNLMPVQPALDEWSRLALLRFPSRHAFLSLLADPAYGPVEPYKKMALELVLVPVSGEVVLPAIPKVPLPGREGLKQKRQENREVKQ